MNELHRYLVEECVEDYVGGRLTRRAALRMLAGLTGAALATQLLDARAQPAPASPAPSAPRSPDTVAPDDPAVRAQKVRFASGEAQITGYLAHPAREGRAPVVLVCHENRGLTRHIEDVTRRVAKAGYVGLAVDLLSREGGTAAVEEANVPAALGKAPMTRFVQDFQGGLAYVRGQPFADAARAGMVGFCFGGGVTWQTAAQVPALKAVVPFYGQPLAAQDVPRLQAAVLAVYAGRDQRIDAMIPAIEEAMRANGKTFRTIVYPDVDHAFHNDTGDRYDEKAARAAWKETLDWFARYLA